VNLRTQPGQRMVRLAVGRGAAADLAFVRGAVASRTAFWIACSMSRVSRINSFAVGL